MPDYNICALCGHSCQEVGQMICGVKGSICHGCVYLCLEIIQSDPKKAESQAQVKPESIPSLEQAAN